MGFQNPLLVSFPVQGITNSLWCLVPNPSFVYIPTQKKTESSWQFVTISFISWNYFPAGHTFHGCDVFGQHFVSCSHSSGSFLNGTFFFVSMVLTGNNTSPVAVTLLCWFLGLVSRLI